MSREGEGSLRQVANDEMSSCAAVPLCGNCFWLPGYFFVHFWLLGFFSCFAMMRCPPVLVSASVLVFPCVGIVFGSLDIFSIYRCPPGVPLCGNCFRLLGSSLDLSLHLTVKISCSNFGHLGK